MIFYEMGNFTFRYCQLTTARRNPNFITVTLHLNNKRLRNTHGYYLETARITKTILDCFLGRFYIITTVTAAILGSAPLILITNYTDTNY